MKKISYDDRLNIFFFCYLVVLFLVFFFVLILKIFDRKFIVRFFLGIYNKDCEFFKVYLVYIL